jgi:DNA-directed RNA polymerase subunit RPC12/RpoP
MREFYKLVCHQCSRAVELPAGKPGQAERLVCPHCGAWLPVDWRPAEAAV